MRTGPKIGEPVVYAKDIANATGLSVRSVRFWTRVLDCEPTFPAHAHHRWSLSAAQRFMRLLAKRYKEVASRPNLKHRAPYVDKIAHARFA